MSRAIVQQRRRTLVDDVPMRTEIGHAVDLAGGEIELHFAVTPDAQHRVIVEAGVSAPRPESMSRIVPRARRSAPKRKGSR